MAKILVQEQLIACANIFDHMTSVYSWKGELKQSSEVVLLLKSKTRLYNKIRKRVESLHPYECPCIIAWSLDQGNKEYLEWINKNLN